MSETARALIVYESMFGSCGRHLADRSPGLRSKADLRVAPPVAGDHSAPGTVETSSYGVRR
jgi:hypothetical protein